MKLGILTIHQLWPTTTSLFSAPRKCEHCVSQGAMIPLQCAKYINTGAGRPQWATYWHQNNKPSGIYLQTHTPGMHLHTFTQKKKSTKSLGEGKGQWDPNISILNYSLNLPSNHDSVIFSLLPHISRFPSHNFVPSRNGERKWKIFNCLGAWRFRVEISSYIFFWQAEIDQQQPGCRWILLYTTRNNMAWLLVCLVWVLGGKVG